MLRTEPAMLSRPGPSGQRVSILTQQPGLQHPPGCSRFVAPLPALLAPCR
ncbi:hypothetical protein ACT9DO_004462 [Salmonella enterica subsp. enterica serovar Catumagos]|nr:hypothetical protein [Salmonella enterica]EKS5411711.1 hypothetical protein [Salmonella enterica]